MAIKEQNLRQMRNEAAEPYSHLFSVNDESTQPETQQEIEMPVKSVTEHEGDLSMSDSFISTRMFIIMISFVIGLYDLSALPTFMHQKNVLGMRPEAIQFFAGLMNIPWSIKPLFGYLFDNIVRRIKRTKYVILATGLIRMCLFMVLAHTNPHYLVFYACLFGMAFCSLFENILSEYTLVITSKHENDRNPQEVANHLPIYFGFRSFGTLIGNFFGGRILANYPASFAFTICSYLPLLVIFVTLIYKEREVYIPDDRVSLIEQLKVIKELLFRDKV